MHVMSSINQCMSSTNQCMPSTNQCMSPINQCMSCYQSTNACHVVGQALTVIIIVSQQNAVQVPALCKLEGNRLWNNLRISCSNCLEHLQAAENIHTDSHVTQAVWDKLYSGLFFLYPFLTGHYKRWWSLLTCIERTAFLPVACGSHRNEGRTVWHPCNTKIWNFINTKWHTHAPDWTIINTR